MAKVKRVSLFVRRISESLSAAGIEILLAKATKLSEGQLNPNGPLLRQHHADPGSLRDQRGDPGSLRSTGPAQRLAAYLAEDPQLLEAVAKLARQEACRIAGAPLPRLETDIRVRAEAMWIFVDVDVEAEAHSVGSIAQGNVELMDTCYALRDVANIFSLKESRLRYWAQTGFINPGGKLDGKARVHI